MSEAVKKTKPAPSDYGPKTVPAILSMAEDAQKAVENKPYPVKAANGGNYIDGIPMLKWGEWKDSSYAGCLTALLNAAGIPVSYEEVMGLSGVCWQAIMRSDWGPSSQMPQNGKLCERNVGDALGISVYTPPDEKAAWALAQNSIDRGIPVLLVGGRHAPEWTLACGYAVENGETRFFGRTYFDVQSNRGDEKVIEGQSTNTSESEIYTENRYFRFNGFPGWVPGALTRFYDRPGPTISRRQALKVSLETCLSMFEQPAGEHHRYGYDAYDVLIQGFELDDEAYRATCGCDQYHLGSLQDARRAARVYLEGAAALLDSVNRTKLQEAARLYGDMLDLLLSAVAYKQTAPVFNVDSAPVWDTARRQALASALKECKALEHTARTVIRDILAHWDEED